MTLKSITLHRAVLNNAGEYVDAGGDDIVVGDKPHQIDADRAAELLKQHGGVGHHEKSVTKTAKKKVTRKPAAKKPASPPSAPVEVKLAQSGGQIAEALDTAPLP